MIKCTALENKRNYRVIDRSIIDPEQRLIDVLFKQEDHRGVGWMIRAMWLKRKDILKNKEDMYKTSQISKKRNKEKLNKSDPGPMETGQTPRERRINRKYHSGG